MNHPDFTKIDFSSLRVLCGGGMACKRRSRPLEEAHRMHVGRATAVRDLARCDDQSARFGTKRLDRLPIPRPRCCAGTDGKEVPLGAAGELCVRGPQVMRGYWNNPSETAKVLGRTASRHGNIANMDGEEGYVRIVDRKKDMLLVSGFNVYPNEIEAVVAMHPGVLE